MPLERVSQGFKDISGSFQRNPLNRDLVILKNETAISRSIRNIVYTQPGEKFFNPNFGSRILNSLFENIDTINASVIRDEIKTSIENYEPRVKLTDVIVSPNFENNEFSVTIVYAIIGLETSEQTLSFALQPTRR